MIDRRRQSAVASRQSPAVDSQQSARGYPLNAWFKSHGMADAALLRMVFKKVEDMKVWQRAMELWHSVNEVLDRPGFQRHLALRDQLNRAIDSVVSNIEEGFDQPTDRAFARFLFTAKASNAEARGRLKRAVARKVISDEELQVRDAIADEVARLLVGLIKHLHKTDRRNRGVGAEGR